MLHGLAVARDGDLTLAVGARVQRREGGPAEEDAEEQQDDDAADDQLAARRVGDRCGLVLKFLTQVQRYFLPLLFADYQS